MIRITSKKNGFRRCGIAHTVTPAEYPDETFSKEQLQTLQAEPMLVVELLTEAPKTPSKPASSKVDQKEKMVDGQLESSQFESWKYEDLKALAKEMGLPFPRNVSKQDLIKLVTAQTVQAPLNTPDEEAAGDQESAGVETAPGDEQ